MSIIKPEKLPSTSGVYFFKDSRGKVLYIGKAVNLRNRVTSYFYNRTADSKIQKMIADTAKVEWQETNSEIEALILESQLIKKNRPKFNVVFRDDKQYFYVAITKEQFPKIFLTHQPKNNSLGVKSEYIGPFTSGGALKTTLRLLRTVFHYCTCKQKHARYCLNYHIGKCFGFCCLKNPGKISTKEKQEYKNNIKSIRLILNGKKSSLSKTMEHKMKTAGEKGWFEKAIDLRNKLAKFQHVFENARIIKDIAAYQKPLAELQKLLKLEVAPSRIEGYDISNIQGRFATGSMIVFIDGQPEKSEYRKFRIRTGDSPDDTKMLKEILTRRLNHPEWQSPDVILIDGGKGQLNAAVVAISKSKYQMPKRIPVIALTKNEKHKGSHIFTNIIAGPIELGKLSTALKNLILKIDSEAHRFAISYYRKLHSKTVLG